jgi:excisionase family DNA binding protein
MVLDERGFYTAQEASTVLGVKTATPYSYVSRKLLRSYQQGIRRQCLCRRSEIERLLTVAPCAHHSSYELPLAESWIRYVG